MTPKSIAIAASAALAAILGFSLYEANVFSAGRATADCGGGQVAGGVIGGPFTLVDATGKTVTDADVIKGPTLVYFGYTFCPDVCPLDSARNSDAVDLLAQKGIDVTPVFISIDPNRDTPEVVGAYASNFGGNMIGLTGSEEQVAAASKAYRTYYQLHDDEDPKYYLVDHSTFTYLMFPGNKFADFFDHTDTAETVAARTACYVAAMG